MEMAVGLTAALNFNIMRGRKPLLTEIKKKEDTMQQRKTLEHKVQPETVSGAPPVKPRMNQRTCPLVVNNKATA